MLSTITDTTFPKASPTHTPASSTPDLVAAAGSSQGKQDVLGLLLVQPSHGKVPFGAMGLAREEENLDRGPDGPERQRHELERHGCRLVTGSVRPARFAYNMHARKV